MRSGECDASTIVKVEIRRRPFEVSQQANGACSCSEKERPPARDAAR